MGWTRASRWPSAVGTTNDAAPAARRVERHGRRPALPRQWHTIGAVDGESNEVTSGVSASDRNAIEQHTHRLRGPSGGSLDRLAILAGFEHGRVQHAAQGGHAGLHVGLDEQASVVRRPAQLLSSQQSATRGDRSGKDSDAEAETQQTAADGRRTRHGQVHSGRRIRAHTRTPSKRQCYSHLPPAPWRSPRLRSWRSSAAPCSRRRTGTSWSCSSSRTPCSRPCSPYRSWAARCWWC